jgi:hypothetical protein
VCFQKFELISKVLSDCETFDCETLDCEILDCETWMIAKILSDCEIILIAKLGFGKLLVCETSGLQDFGVLENISSRNFGLFRKKTVFSKIIQFFEKTMFSKILQFFENPISQRNFEIIQFRNLAKSRSIFFLIQERQYRVSNCKHERDRFWCSRKLVKV